MKNIEDIIVKESTSILEVLQIIDKSSKQLAIVVDDNKKLLGTISDGDIRRALLQNISLNDVLKKIYFKTPTVANVNDSKEDIINICRIKKIHQIPVVDNNGNLIGLEIASLILESVIIISFGRPVNRSRPRMVVWISLS